ncbi:MFS transporter [Clostridium estertheticum]|uniref:MFS transporter n=1 Tax=Clostridium estertheticum TaxID=238834 RepID=UPI0013E99410|nr:MFS transporter [Clostridium estertheticum]MBZ9686837.1 MFS transporter [Clostridium estertheticum]
MKLIKNRIFMTILATDIIQQLAIWVRNISIMFFVMEISKNNPLAVSTLNLVEYVPMVLLTFVGGVIADKYNPKKLMILGDSLSSVSFIVLGYVMAKGLLISIFAVVLISATVTQFSYPASQKYFKEYIPEEQVEQAVGISQLLGSMFYVIGPFLGSYFYFKFGIKTTLVILSMLFLVSIALISTLPNKKFHTLESDGFKEDVKLTFKYVKENKTILRLFKVFALLSFTLGIANNLDIFVVTERLGLDKGFYQFFSGVAGVGVVVGGLLYVVFAKYLSNFKVLFIFITVLTVTIFFEGYSTMTVVTIALQFIDNAMLSIISIYVVASITKVTDQEYLGKVNGLSSTIMYLGISIGTIFSGIAMKSISLVFAYGVGSSALLILILVLYLDSKKGNN